MTDIRLGVWEKNDLIRILDYAKIKKMEDYKAGKLTSELFTKDLKTIRTLQNRAMGKDYKKEYEIRKGGVEC